MERFFAGWVLVFVVASCLLPAVVAQEAAPPDQGKEPQTHEGVVLTSSADTISIRAADGKEHSFKINAMTRVTVHGKPGKLTDLKAGMPARVMVDSVGKVATVSTVDDRKQPAGFGAAAS
jgi:hypothetical protein